ncbi:MAG: FecR family protein [Cyclobacteriaceae bacterium]
MELKDYQLEDFLQDRDFINWVLQADRESDVYWNSWMESHPEKAALALRAKRIISEIKFQQPEHDPQQFDRVLQNVIKTSPRLSKKSIEETTKLKNLKVVWMGRAAAAILFAITFGLVTHFNQNQNTKTDILAEKYITKANPRGKKSTLMLPDSTKVTLNAESSLRIPSNFMSNRTVELSGEAYFEVKRKASGSPFRVNSKELSTVVLGTTFSVKAYDDATDVSVMLRTGKVIVERIKDDEIYSEELLPGEKAVLNPDMGFLKSTFDINSEMAWKDGILIFQKTSLQEFIDIIERWYDVTVLVSGKPTDTWRINGRFNNEELKNVLESLKFAKEINYELKNNVVTLKF